jgi:predicted alpha/beta superfamily hydrolase
MMGNEFSKYMRVLSSRCGLRELMLIAAAALTQPLVTAVRAQEAVADPVPTHDTLTLTSRALGEARRVNVHTPRSYTASAAARFPVLYMPDGGLDEDFAHVVNTVDSLINVHAIRPVIVVGVPNTERRRDLTGPTRIATDSAIAPHVGGSAAFRRFLRDELIPAIDARYRTTRERAIVGESLAGLFVVETFLHEPTSFDHYVAFDPSLWWNHGALADSVSSLLTVSRTRGRTIYIASSRDDRDDATARFAAAFRIAAPRGVVWTYVSRPDLTHGNVFRAVAPAALASALR